MWLVNLWYIEILLQVLFQNWFLYTTLYWEGNNIYARFHLIQSSSSWFNSIGYKLTEDSYISKVKELFCGDFFPGELFPFLRGEPLVKAILVPGTYRIRLPKFSIHGNFLLVRCIFARLGSLVQLVLLGIFSMMSCGWINLLIPPGLPKILINSISTLVVSQAWVIELVGEFFITTSRWIILNYQIVMTLRSFILRS